MTNLAFADHLAQSKDYSELLKIISIIVERNLSVHSNDEEFISELRASHIIIGYILLNINFN